MDAALTRAVRDAEARNDGPSWAAASQTLLRAGQLERAAVAARRAIARGTDAMELLDATAPSLEALTSRTIDVARRADDGSEGGVYVQEVRWAPTGGTLVGMGAAQIYVSKRHGMTAGLVLIDLVACTHRLVTTDAVFLHAVALDGATAVVTRSRGDLAAMDLGDGFARPIGGVRARDVWSVSLTTRPAVVFVALAVPSRAIAFDLSSVGRSPRRLIDVACLGGSFDTTGALAYDDGEELLLHDPLDQAPRVRVTIGAGSRYRKVWACGRRAVVADDDLALFGADGSILGRVPLPPNARAGRVAASPTGRLCLVEEPVARRSTHRVTLVDLVTGARKTLDLDGPLRAAAWSPSGRRLALALDRSRIVLLEPGPVRS